jgi:hypothetical protein
MCCQVLKYVLVNAKIVLFNVNMARDPQQKPTRRVSRSSSEALRILASLIAQSHIRKLTGDRKTKISTCDSREAENDRNLPGT